MIINELEFCRRTGMDTIKKTGLNSNEIKVAANIGVDNMILLVVD